MSIDSIKDNSTNFVSNQNKTSITTKPETKIEEKKYGKEFLVTGLVALGAIGIYLATRCKKGPKDIPPEVQKPLDEITDLTIDAFKQSGNKIERGVAKLANGENYTGKLARKLKNGKVLLREYKDGILTNVKLMEGKHEISSKIFQYDKNSGKLTSIISGKNIKGLGESPVYEYEKMLEKVYDADGKLKYLYKQKNNSRKENMFIEFYPNGKRKYMITGEFNRYLDAYDILHVYDKKGNLEYRIKSVLPPDLSVQGRVEHEEVMNFAKNDRHYLWTSKVDVMEGAKTQGIDDTIAIRYSSGNTSRIKIFGGDYLTKTEPTVLGLVSDRSPVDLGGDIGQDIVKIERKNGAKGSIKYNKKTKQFVDFPKDYPYTEEQVRNYAEELLNEARDVKQEVQKQKEFSKKYYELCGERLKSLTCSIDN